MKHHLLLASFILLVGCGGGEEQRPLPGRPAPVEPFDDDRSGVSQAAGPAPTTAPAPAPKNHDGPHISRSVGEEGGLVVFWPRVIPKTDDTQIRGYASELQSRLVNIAKKKYAGKIDTRPEPERVCPRSGCKAATLGVLLLHRGGGCTAVALVSGPGKAAAKLVPWAGRVELKKQQVPFREYPESQVTIRDAVPCGELIGKLGEKEADVLGAL